MLDYLSGHKYNHESFLSSRTKLYNIEPIGVGTPYVESLSSYISRLASEHNLSVSALLGGMVTPILNKDYLIKELDIGITASTSRFINDNSIITLEFVEALELLTGRKDLRNLTMLNWMGIFPHNIRSPYRKWCPSCLNQLNFESRDVYEPLIWYLEDITKCDKHEIQLQKECPNCNRRLPFLHSRFMVGYCQYCGSWLGNSGITLKEELSAKEEFINLNYKQLIENAPSLTLFPSKAFFLTFLNRLIAELGFRSRTRLANFLGYSHNTVREWCNGEYLPSHTTLLNIAQKVNKTIFEIIYEEDIKFNIDIKKYNYSKRKSITRDELEYHLKKGINLDEPISLYKIAKEAGFSIDTARRHFPILCKEIQEKYESYKEILKIQKQKEIKEMLNECLIREIPISFNNLLKEYGFAEQTVRRCAPELCKKVSLRYKVYLSKLKEERIENILGDIHKVAKELQLRGIYPSKGKIEKELNNKGVFLEEEIREGWEDIVIKLGYKLE